MRINPTFGIVNKVVTFGLIPRGRMYNCLQISVVVFALTGRFKAFAIVFGFLWLGFFIAFLRDPQYITYLWRSSWRGSVLSFITVSRSTDRKRIEYV